MGERLRAELKQRKPFSSVAEEAILNVERTADRLRHMLQQTLKPSGITGTQFNALRILRGARPDGLTCSELGERLVSSDPDITRLLERLARQGLISRRRGTNDKRVVLTEISERGLALLEEIDPIVEESAKRFLAHMSQEKLHTLIDLLEEARLPFMSQGEGAGKTACPE